MRAFIHFFILLFTFLIALLGIAQTPSVKEITIDPQLLGDLYTTTTKNENLAILVPGSGPTNRNGNSPIGLKGNSYKMLATALAPHQLDVFTYDKRIIAQMKANQVKEEDTRFEDGVTDLALIVDYFAAQYSHITLVGHSEGALLANLLANKSSKVTKFVSLQGPGTTADQIIYNKLCNNYQL